LLAEVDSDVSDALEFWISRSQKYKLIYPIAVDLLSAPASQAFVERIFSLCGLLSAGRRNRMHRSMEIRAYLELNASIIEY
jgi:hypothetical protein